MNDLLLIAHRINKISELKKIPLEYGVEVDIRTYNGQLILNHEAFENGDSLEEYLKCFKHKFIILEIKEEGIEKEVISLCKKYKIENYFLLSVSLPFIYLLSKEGIRKMALRFSEFESIDTCLSMKGKADWVWIDTFTKNPLTKKEYITLKNAGFKLCLVSPSRWGRSEEISKYKDYFKKNDMVIDAVMCENDILSKWK